MNASMQFMNDAWQWLAGQMSDGSVVIWSASFVVFLIFSALVLAYTRFGQERPVMTCVGLSVLAHLILVAMASRILLSHPVGSLGGEVASINVLDFDESEFNSNPENPEDENDPDDSEKITEPWNDFNAVIPEVSMPQLLRPQAETEVVLERHLPEIPDLAVSEVSAPAPIPSLPDIPSPETAIPRPAPTVELQSDVAPASPAESQRLDAAREIDPLDNVDLLALPEHPDPGPAPDQLADSELENHAMKMLQEAIESERKTNQWEMQENSVPDLAPIDVAARQIPNHALTPIETSELNRRVSNATRPDLRAADATPMPVEYSLRSSPDRQAIVARHGGSAATEQAVRIALQWLAANQSIDGRWDPRTTGGGVERKPLNQDRQGAGSRADTGITGLALLAFLSGGNTHMDGEYQESVRRGLDFLKSIQATDGNLAADATLYERMYCHSMATLAMGEAFAMTGDENLRDSLTRAVEYSIRAQSPQDGGWRYQPGDSGDLSQFGWVVLGLKSATIAGIDVPRETYDGMNRFLHQCTRGPNRGLGCYRSSEGPSPTMTAEGLVCRYLLESTPRQETVNEAVTYLGQNPPSISHINYYYWYYGTMALYQAGGADWERWNESLVEILVSRQIQTGINRGSWPADGVWAGYGGKVYSTAMATLCLEVYYRYMPVYEALRENPEFRQR